MRFLSTHGGGIVAADVPDSHDRSTRTSSAERLVPSIKEECLDRSILMGHCSLRMEWIRDFLARYHFGCNHQALGNRLMLLGASLLTPLESDRRC